MDHTDRFLFVDVETTGLENYDVMLEFGARLTDSRLVTIDEFHVLTWSSQIAGRVNTIKRTAEDEKADPDLRADAQFVLKMHTDNGLFEHAEKVGIHPEAAHDQFKDWMGTHGLGRKDAVCGSSVHFDRGVMERYFTEANRKLSYRNIDISTLQEIATRWYPHVDLNEMRTKQMGKHRVMPDLDDSIRLFKFLKSNVLKERTWR